MLPHRSNQVVVGILATLLLHTGCTRLQPIETAEGAALEDVIDVGDRVRVFDAGGRSTDLKVTAIDAEWLVGTTSAGEAIERAWAEVRQVRERIPAPGLTATLIALGVARWRSRCSTTSSFFRSSASWA